MAQEYGVPMAMHFAGTPVSCMANVHCAAATENFLVLENHSVDVPWWDDLVDGHREADRQQGLRHGAGQAGAGHHAERRRGEAAPGAGHGLLRADREVEQRAELGPALQLGSRSHGRKRTTGRRSPTGRGALGWGRWTSPAGPESGRPGTRRRVARRSPRGRL